MPELTINPSEITEVLRKHLEGFKPTLDRQQVGQIVEVGDGIARISGLPTVSVNELLEFHGGALGLALNLDEESIGAVVLGGLVARVGDTVIDGTVRRKLEQLKEAL